MKKMLLVAALMSSGVCGQAEKPKGNQTDFPLTAHVAGSMIGTYVQEINAVIDGQCLRLNSKGTGMLVLGDYPARPGQYPSLMAPKHHTAYDQWNAYDLLMPDGSVRTFWVVASGSAVPGGCGTNAH